VTDKRPLSFRPRIPPPPPTADAAAREAAFVERATVLVESDPDLYAETRGRDYYRRPPPRHARAADLAAAERPAIDPAAYDAVRGERDEARSRLAELVSAVVVVIDHFDRQGAGGVWAARFLRTSLEPDLLPEGRS